MRKQSALLLLAAFTVLFTFAALGGGTGDGLLTPQYRNTMLVLLAAGVIWWAISRWRGKWKWHKEPLSLAFALWAFAIGFSLVANLDVWRRIVIGIWFVLLYGGLWFVLQDLLTNKRLKRETLIDSMLFSSIPVLIYGYMQLWYWLSNWLQLATAGMAPPFDVPRLYSTLVNPNVLAAFLVSLIPLAVMRFITAHRTGRILLALYILLAIILLVTTDSRGGWIGLAAGMGVFAVLLLAHYHMLSIPSLRLWYAARSLAWKWGLLVAVAAALAVGIGITFVLLRSLGESGRTIELRTYIYDVAIKVFEEKPIAGSGLFTFGRALLQYASTPPLAPHSNAHDLPLNVAAEMGLFGLLALMVSVIAATTAIWRNWHKVERQQRVLFIGCVASTCAFAVHHLLDLPASGTPIVFIIGMVTLLIAITPLQPTALGPARQRFQSLIVIGTFVIVFAVGFWSTALYSAYVEALRYGSATRDFSGAAAQLQTSIQHDPDMPIYYMYQGYFLGLSGLGGNVNATRQAIAAYKRFCDLEPYYAPAWANLGSLYWQLGESAQAIDAMQHAAQIAPQAWAYQFNLGLYYEMTGQLEAARQSYLATLALNADASLYPEWQQSALRQSIAAQNVDYSPQAKVGSLLVSGDIKGAQQLWEQLPTSESETTSAQVIEEILALSRTDKIAADSHLKLATRASGDAENDPWILVGRAAWAQFNGNPGLAAQERDMARSVLDSNSISDEVTISAIAFSQFWTIGIYKYSLPGVYSPTGDPLVTMILERGLDEF